jgi:hypothetical protein
VRAKIKKCKKAAMTAKLKLLIKIVFFLKKIIFYISYTLNYLFQSFFYKNKISFVFIIYKIYLSRGFFISKIKLFSTIIICDNKNLNLNFFT